MKAQARTVGWFAVAAALGLVGAATWRFAPSPASLDDEPLPHRFVAAAPDQGSVFGPCVRVWTHARSFEFQVQTHALGRPWTVRGSFKPVSASVRLPGEASGEASTASVEVTLDAGSIESGSSMRDEHLRAPDLLDVARFPTMALRSSAVRMGADRVDIDGTLALFGHTVAFGEGQPDPYRPITLHAASDTGVLGTKPVRLTGRFAIRRSDVGMMMTETRTWDARNLAVQVDDRVDFGVDVELRPCGEPR